MIRVAQTGLGKRSAIILILPIHAGSPLKALGADIRERESLRIAVVLFGEVRVRLIPDTDKGAVARIRKWLEKYGEAP